MVVKSRDEVVTGLSDFSCIFNTSAPLSFIALKKGQRFENKPYKAAVVEPGTGKKNYESQKERRENLSFPVLCP